MKQTNFLKSFFLLCALIVGSSSVWAISDSYTATFEDKPTATNGTTSGSVTGTSSITWSYSVTQETKSGKSPYVAHSDDNGWQLGSSNSPCTAFSISTSGISGTITKIVVETGSYNASSRINCTVGGSNFGTQNQTSGNGSVNKLTFTGSASGEIIVSATASTRAFYFKSVTVTYTSSYSVTYNGNGATSGSAPTDATAYSSGATVTVLGQGTLVKTGYGFSGWNTKADGTGTNYDEDDTFSITTSTTLYAKWVPYAITAVSSNESYGTVSLDGFVITGSPESGYRYASPAYSVTSGSATVSQEGNVFTVTPTSNCTVRINFEAIPTHTITCVADPAVAGTFNVVSSLFEGGTTNITALANSGYKFTGWSVSGTGATLSSASTNPTTLTMGTANVTVTATFESVTTYAISYSVNGSVIKTVNVEKDEAVDLSAPASGIPSGYVFRGWVVEANKIDTPTNTDPNANYVTSATSTADITYYAVMAVQTVALPDTYEKLASNSFDANATYVIGGIQGGSGGDGTTIMYFNSYGDTTDEDLSWGTCTSAPSTNAPVTFKLSGTAGELVAKDNSGNYLTCITVKKFAMSSTSTTVYLHTDGSIKSASEGNLLRYNHNDGNGGLRWYGSATGAQAYFYKVVENGTYANYCTTVPTTTTITLNAACTDGEMVYGTFSYPVAFVVSDDIVVSEIGIVEGKLYVEDYDEGDIVPANTGVMVSAIDGGDYVVNLSNEAGSSVLGSDNRLRGTVTGITAEAMAAADANCQFYRLTMHNGTDLGFWWGAAEGAAFGLGANKAYLAVSGSVNSKDGLTFGGSEEEIDGINAVVNNAENGIRYNLAGQRVGNDYKGIVIVNGKKYLRK